MSVLTKAHPSSPELTTDPHFGRRLRRLVAVSAIALGIIWILAVWRGDGSGAAIALLVAGWIIMPVLIASSIRHPRLRYLLGLPAGLVVAGLLMVATAVPARSLAGIGWWSMTAGVSVGATLGTWFWYRAFPVPARFDDPFSPGRWALIAVHAGLVVAGILLVLAA